MSTFNLLSVKIQKKVWDMGWSSFTPVQESAIPAIIETQKDVILSSGTASGKTEAAFLPILSLVEKEAEEKLKVVYISPLKALINNQFDRIEKLCEHTHVPIHRWHGDISQSKKKQFLKKPNGILQITPESMESLFVNRTNQLRAIFEEAEFIIIDEIHSFLDGERGVHLRSLLSRMEHYTKSRPRIIGLSATIDNFAFVKGWVNKEHPENVEIVQPPSSDKELLYSLMHFQMKEDRKVPLELFEDMREITKEDKALIFSNSRGQVEETTVLMNRLAEKDGVGETYYAHHSSIDKKEREYVEKTMTSSSLPKSVIATSSLELGIDVGSIDIVVQLDSTFTVSALKQRLGRSGRKQADSQKLQLYSTTRDSLLQSLAVMELVREQWVEPAKGYAKPYDILFHQLLSICKETNGIQFEQLLEEVSHLSVFSSLEIEKVQALIEWMVEKEQLEKIKGSNELIVGLEGERLMRGKEFYSVFMTSQAYDVLEGVRKIGQIDKLEMLSVGDNIILAGKLWTLNIIDTDQNKVYVKKAADAKAPKYLGGGVKINDRIAQKMMGLLCEDTSFDYADEKANSVLADMRRPYQAHGVRPTERVIWKETDELLFETFIGTVVVKTLIWMFRSEGIEVSAPDGLERISFLSSFDVEATIERMKKKEWTPEELMEHTRKNEFYASKYMEFLPESLQKEMHVAHEVDIEGALNYLDRYAIKMVEG